MDHFNGMWSFAVFDEEKNEWRIWYNGRAGNTEYIGLACKQGDFEESDFE